MFGTKKIKKLEKDIATLTEWLEVNIHSVRTDIRVLTEALEYRLYSTREEINSIKKYKLKDDVVSCEKCGGLVLKKNAVAKHKLLEPGHYQIGECGLSYRSEPEINTTYYCKIHAPKEKVSKK